MRLVCPNCDAQYEVGDDAIPAGGRDVQCSNCGHAWFQLSPEVEAAMIAETELFDPPEVMAQPSAVQAPDFAAEAEPPQPAATANSVRRRSLDESVLAVLREEAEREAGVRRTEQPRPLETQSELGLETALAPVPAVALTVSPVARRIAELKGVDPDAPPPLTAFSSRAVARRELFPDIEEINSSLRASSDRGPGTIEDFAGPDDHPRRSGFRSGFVLMMVIAVVLASAYVMAPRIVQKIPASADTMAAFVSAIDCARLWLDGLMRQAITTLQGIGGPAD